MKRHRFITISTTNYKKHTERLLNSLLKTNRNFELQIYCDSRRTFEDLEDLGSCQVIELESIRKLGPKRAKFEAYSRAIKDSSFLYLDSDILVLKDLAGLFGGKNLAGCPDDLKHCPFIADTRHPWVKEPELENQKYINSGVFFMPRSQRKRVDRLYLESQNNDSWERYIIEGKLYDNHFLCAYLNKWNWRMDSLDAEVYNWQGFFGPNHQSLAVFRTKDGLVNRANVKELALVHFAGINDIDAFMVRLPLSVSSLLATLGASESRLVSDEIHSSLLYADAHFRKRTRLIPQKDLWTPEDLRQATGALQVVMTESNPTCEVGQRITLPVHVRNLSERSLSVGPELPLKLSYHWKTSEGTVVTWDGERSGILPIAPGGESREFLHVLGPANPGLFLLEVTLVVEGSFWLDEVDPGVSVFVPVKVTDPWMASNRLKNRISQYLNHEFLDRAAIRRSHIGQSQSGISIKKRPVPVVVSLTSFPARIHDVDLCVLSLLKQTEKPDAILLNLSEEEFSRKEEDLPKTLLELRSAGLEIQWTENWRVYNKLVPTLLRFPDAVVITVDDDIYYSQDLVGSLYDAHRKYPKEILCRRMHRITTRANGRFGTYAEWSKDVGASPDCDHNFATGVGGVLYPPHSLDHRVAEPSLFQGLCPWNDDLWYWAMATLAGTKVRLVGKGRPSLRYLDLDRDLGDSSDFTLGKINVTGRANEEQLNNLFEAFPQLRNVPHSIVPGQKLAVLTITMGSQAFFPQVRSSMANFARKCGADFIEKTEPALPSELDSVLKSVASKWPSIVIAVQKLYSIWEAFEAGYDRVLVLDDSCVVLDHTPNLFELVPDGEIAAYPESNDSEMVAPAIGNRFLMELRMVRTQEYYNGGILLVTSRWKALFSPSELLANVDLFECHYPIQTFINYQFHRFQVPMWNLPRRWNYVPYLEYSDPANRKRDSLPQEYMKTLAQQNILNVTGFFEKREAIVDQLYRELVGRPGTLP